MKNILTSASKIVFILMAVGANVGFFMKILTAEQYMTLCGMAFAFYFAVKPTDASGTITK